MSDTQRGEDTRGILQCEECIAPAEAFAVVGNETRLSILEALWTLERPAAFSELRREVGMRDSAQFNYHLSKLTGQFVTKTDDGYDFLSPGRAVIQAVLSGTLNQDPEIEPFEIEGECVDCGGPLAARYQDERVLVNCVDCDRPHGNFPFPPGGLEDRSREELMDAFNQRARHLSCLSADGVCPECNGRMETHVDRPDGDFLDLDVVVVHECARCEYEIVSSVGLALLDDAEVVAFYRDHGIDLNQVPFWTLEWCVTDRHTTVVSDEPWQVEITVPVEDEELVVTMDDDLAVLETDRRERAPV
jgi:hypothetical protein